MAENSDIKRKTKYISETGLTGEVQLFSLKSLFLEIGTYRTNAIQQKRNRKIEIKDFFIFIYFPVSQGGGIDENFPVIITGKQNEEIYALFCTTDEFIGFLQRILDNNLEIFFKENIHSKEIKIEYLSPESKYEEMNIASINFLNLYRRPTGIDIVKFTQYFHKGLSPFYENIENRDNSCYRKNLDYLNEDSERREKRDSLIKKVFQDTDQKMLLWIAEKMNLDVLIEESENDIKAFFLEYGKYGQIVKKMYLDEVRDTINKDFTESLIYFTIHKSILYVCVETPKILIEEGLIDKFYEYELDLKSLEYFFSNSLESALIKAKEHIKEKIINDLKHTREYFSFEEIKRKLNLVEKITVEDSYRVGNCKIGTEKFIRKFNLPSEMTGNELINHKDFKEMSNNSQFKRVIKKLIQKISLNEDVLKIIDDCLDL